MLVPACSCGVRYPASPILAKARALRQSPDAWVPLPVLPCPWSPFHTPHDPGGCFPQRVQKQEMRPWQDQSLGLTSTPLLSSSPEKDAFKKRQKLQQDKGEETDENEVEEVSGLRAHTEGGAWVIVISPRGRGTKPSLALQAGWRGHGVKDSMLE